MMQLEDYYCECDGCWIVTAEQGSRFAKEVAGDFNPIHDPLSRRFCVPGDLFFALVLRRVGLHQTMSFRFSNMVGDTIPLTIDESGSDHLRVIEDSGKECLDVKYSGEATRDPVVIEQFTRQYVAFSGRNFPHLLKPLMEQHGVMFHPQRPLVIYDRMDFSFHAKAREGMKLEFDGASMDVERRRALVWLRFKFMEECREIGSGSKKMIVSGLRPYDAAIMDGVVEEFYRLKNAYEQSDPSS